MITVELDSFLSRGSEWGYLDNSKQLIFSLCNSKFYAEGNKTPPKGQCYFVQHINKFSATFRRFPIISEDFRRFPKTTEDVRRLPKFSKEKSEKYNASSLSSRNSLRCFLTAATLDCFERSKVTLLYAFRKQNPPCFCRSSLEL